MGVPQVEQDGNMEREKGSVVMEYTLDFPIEGSSRWRIRGRAARVWVLRRSFTGK